MLPRIDSSVYDRFVATKWQCVFVCLLVAWGWSLFFDRGLHLRDTLLIVGIVSAAYQTNRITDHEDSINCPSEWKSAQRRRTKIIGLAVISVTLALSIALASGNAVRIVGTSLCLVAGFLYSIPVFHRRRLKQIIGIKNILSALGWTTVCVLITLPDGQALVSKPLLVATAVNVSLVFVVEVLWDIRDENGDRLAGVNTIPVVMGYTKAIRVCLSVNTFCALAVFVSLLFGFLPPKWIVVVGILFLVEVWLLLGPAVHRDRRYSHVLQAMIGLLAIGGGLAV